MKKTLSKKLLAVGLFCSVIGFGASRAPAADPALTLNVWPGKPPGDTTDVGPEKWDDTTLTNVATPTIAVYRPDKSIDTGAAVIICPGGGFYKLSMGHEGADVATWFNSIGVTGIVLKYRIPNRPNMPKYMAALQDAQRAMCIVRTKAAEWNIDPHRIGMLGFSAGGQVTVDVETNFDKLMYPPLDDMDKADTRPDFAIDIYPGGITQKDDVNALTPDVRVSKQTPPTFIAIADNDRGGPENGVDLYLALHRAGVPAELHVYAEGGHGFGIRPGTAPHASWPARVQDWMRYRKLFTPAGATTQPVAAMK